MSKARDIADIDQQLATTDSPTFGDVTLSGTEPKLYISETDTSSSHRIVSSGGALYIQAEDSDGTSDGDLHLTGMLNADLNLLNIKAATTAMNGNITVTGTVDGRDVATDGTKLDILGHVYASRAAAQAATVPAAVLQVFVLDDDATLVYVRDATGTALTTADGANWSPDGAAHPAHWGITTTGDQQTALVAMITWTTANKVTIEWPADKTFEFSGEIDVEGYVDWTCSGKFGLYNTKTVVTNPSEFQGDKAIEVTSTQVATTTVTSDFETGDDSFLVTSVTGIAVGDIVKLSTTRLIDTDNRGAWTEGQLLKVTSIVGLRLYFSDTFDYSGKASDTRTGTLQAIDAGRRSVTVDSTFALGNGRDMKVKLTITNGTSAGESRMIVGVSNSNLTLRHDDVRDVWPAGVLVGDAYLYEWSSSIEVYRPEPCSITGMVLSRDAVTTATLGDNSFRGLRLEYLDAPKLTNCDIFNFATTNLLLSVCYRPNVYGMVTAGANRSFSDSDGTGYGISCLVCAYPSLVNIRGYGNRRTVDLSGSSGYTNHGVCDNVTASGGGTDYTGGLFFPLGTSRQQVCGSHGSGRFSIFRNCSGTDVYGGVNLRGRTEVVSNFTQYGYTNYCVQVTYGSGHTIDGLVYDDKFTERTADKDFRTVIASKYTVRPEALIYMTGGDPFSTNLITSFRNVVGNSVTRCGVYAQNGAADDLEGLHIENLHVTCTPDGTIETDFALLYCPNSPVMGEIYMENCHFTALAPYTGGAVLVRTYGTGDADAGSFTMAAGAKAKINGVWFIDVQNNGVTRIPFDGNMAHVSVINDRTGTRSNGFGIVVETDSALDRAVGITNRTKIDLLAAYPTDGTAVTAGNIGLHLSKGEGNLSIASNNGTNQSFRVTIQ